MRSQELYDWAEKNQIEVDYFPMRQVAAVSFPEGWVALDVDKLRDTAEEKACLAHELGHCATGSFYNINSPCDLREKKEACAARWAIRTLIPEDELDRVVADGVTEPWELAEVFGVPEPFMRQAMAFYLHQEEGRSADHPDGSFFRNVL